MMCCHCPIRILLASWKTLSPSQCGFIDSSCPASLLCSLNHNVCMAASPGCSLARWSPLTKHCRLGSSSQAFSQLVITFLISEHLGRRALPSLRWLLFCFKNGEFDPSLTSLDSLAVLPYVWLASNQVVMLLACSLSRTMSQFGIEIPTSDLE